MKQPEDKKEHKLTHKIRNREELKITGDKLLGEPHTDVSEYNTKHKARKLLRADLLRTERVEDGNKHCNQLKDNMNSIYRMESTVVLNKLCSTVEEGKRNAFIIPIKMSRGKNHRIYQIASPINA